MLVQEALECGILLSSKRTTMSDLLPTGLSATLTSSHKPTCNMPHTSFYLGTGKSAVVLRNLSADCDPRSPMGCWIYRIVGMREHQLLETILQANLWSFLGLRAENTRREEVLF